MKTTKKCAFCGRMFTPNSGMQKYCTVHCADEAKKRRRSGSRTCSMHQFRKAGVFLLTGIGWKQRGTKDTLTDRVRLLVVAEGVRNV